MWPDTCICELASYACHSSKEKSHLVLCSQVYHTDGVDGQQLFNYFQIRLPIFSGCTSVRLKPVPNDSHSLPPQNFSSTPENIERVLLNAATARQRAWIQVLHTKKMQLLKFQYNGGSAWNLGVLMEQTSIFLPRDVLDAFWLRSSL